MSIPTFRFGVILNSVSRGARYSAVDVCMSLDTIL